jgi:hypothetical protein
VAQRLQSTATPTGASAGDDIMGATIATTSTSLMGMQNSRPPSPPPSDQLRRNTQVNPNSQSFRAPAPDVVPQDGDRGDMRHTWMPRMDFPTLMAVSLESSWTNVQCILLCIKFLLRSGCQLLEFTCQGQRRIGSKRTGLHRDFSSGSSSFRWWSLNLRWTHTMLRRWNI